MNSPTFAVLDFETTGFRPSDRVLEIGVVTLDAEGNPEEKWQTLVQPDRHFDNTNVHGIQPSMVSGAPRFSEVAKEFAERINGRIMVAHNAPFETRFLRNEFQRLHVQLPEDIDWTLCTQAMAQRYLDGNVRKLSDCLKVAGINNRHPHAALGDAEATAELFRHFLPKMRGYLDSCKVLNLNVDGLGSLESAPVLPRKDLSSSGAKEHWLARLAASTSSYNSDEAAREYLNLLADVLVDGRLDEGEVESLVELASTHHLGADDVAELHDRFLRSLAVDAWADGVVTPSERSWIIRIADELQVPHSRVTKLLVTPAESRKAGSFNESALELLPGDRVTFTGALALPREEWEARASAAGLNVGGIRQNSKLLVSADLDSMSGKMQRARRFGVPVVDEPTFTRLLQDLLEQEPDLSEISAEDTHTTADGSTESTAEPTGTHGVKIVGMLREEDGTRNSAFNALQKLGEPSTESPAGPGAGYRAYLNTPSTPEAQETAAENTQPQAPEAEPSTADAPSISWQKIFPWLVVDPRITHTATNVAEEWLAQHHNEQLSDISPVLSPQMRPTGLQPDQLVVSRWFARYPEPLRARVTDLEDVPGVGRMRLQSLVYSVVLLALDEWDSGEDHSEELTEEINPGLLDGELESIYEEPSDELITPDVYHADDEGRTAESHLRLLSGWAALTGQWPKKDDETLPTAVRQAMAITDPTAEIIEEARLEFLRALGGDERYTFIFQKRFQGNKTLEEIGKKLRLTRERVRQLARALQAEVDENCPALNVLITAIGQRIDPWMRKEDLLDALPMLKEPTATSRQFLLDLAALAKQQWRLEQEWLVKEGAEQRLEEAIDRHADHYGVADVSELAEAMGTTPKDLTAWLRKTQRAWVRGGLARTRQGSVVDRAIAELSIRNNPMSGDTLAKVMKDRSKRSIANALSLDPRVHRCGLDRWALTEWGLEEWTTITDFLRRRIEAAGSQGASLKELQREVVRYGASPKSLLSYASSPEFEIINGRVFKSTAEAVNAATPQEARGLYLRDGVWSLLFTVNADALRGSGMPVPGAIAALYDVPFNGQVQVPSDLGPQTITWRANTYATSTIRRFLEHLGAEEGQRVWLHFGPNKFEVTKATDAVETNDPIAKLLNATGLDDLHDPSQLDGAEAMKILAEAIGLSPETPRRRIISAMWDRRDQELEDLLRSL